MNDRPDHSGFEQQLGDALRRRGDDSRATPVSFGDVRDRAGSIRRRRTTIAAAGAVAAVALLVPVGFGVAGLVGSEDPRDDSLVAADGAAPTQDATPEPEPAPEPVAGTVALVGDFETGEAPALAWSKGREVHLARDGQSSTAVVETEKDYDRVVVLGTRILGWTMDPNTGYGTIDEVASDGSVIESTPAVTAPMANATSQVAAWVAEDGSIVFATPSENSVIHEGQGLFPSVVDTEGVWLTGEAGYGATRLDLDGTTSEPLGDVVRVNGSQGPRVTTTSSVDDHEPGSCGTVQEGRTVAWETCEHTLLDFSPAGTWVRGTDEYLDGIGQRTLTILDAATGDVQVSYDATDASYIGEARWEDDSHVLVQVFIFEDQTWQLLRLGLDGSIEHALEPTQEGDEMESPYRL